MRSLPLFDKEIQFALPSSTPLNLFFFRYPNKWRPRAVLRSAEALRETAGTLPAGAGQDLYTCAVGIRDLS
jgi:hypothetical protein